MLESVYEREARDCEACARAAMSQDLQVKFLRLADRWRALNVIARRPDRAAGQVRQN